MEKINALCGLQMSLTCGCVFLLLWQVPFAVSCTIKCSSAFEEPGKNCSACQCINGYYRLVKIEGSVEGCEPCLVTCKKPKVLMGKCFGNVNSRCEACPKGTFYNETYGCVTCQVDCPFGIVTNCTLEADTICKDSPKGNATARIIHVFHTRDKSSIKWLWVGLLLGFFIGGICFCMVAFLVWRYCCTRTEKSDLAMESGSNISLVQNCNLPQQRNRHFELTAEERMILVRDLPGCCVDQMALLLNPSNPFNDWRTLAGILNYTLNDMANFVNDYQYIQNLFLAWGVKNCATVGVLLEALRQMGRDDAYDVLATYIVNERLPQEGDEELSSLTESVIISQHAVSDTSLTDSASNASCTTHLITSRDSDVSGMYSESSI